MKRSSSFALYFLLPLAMSARIDYGRPQPQPQPTPQPQQPNDGYGGTTAPTPAPTTTSRQQCTPFFEDVVTDHCENYVERICRTTHQESCQDIPGEECRAVVTNREVRKCFNVTELICKLREDVKYEVINVGFTVQKCHKVTERVCDTVYDTSFITKDDFQCLTLNNPSCTEEPFTIQDKICTTTTQFDCPTTAMVDAPAQMMQATQQSQPQPIDSSYRRKRSIQQSYGVQEPTPTQPQPTPQPQPEVPLPKPKCQRRQSTKCRNIPRTVTRPNCNSAPEKVCEKVTEKMPSAEERQNCHDEDKKVCELEERTQPKQVKKYVYTKQCRSVPRTVCENAEAKTLVPSCMPSNRKQCTYSPRENCEDAPKEHCFKVTTKIRRERCETVTSTTQPQPQPTQGYGQQSQQPQRPQARPTAQPQARPQQGFTQPQQQRPQVSSGWESEPAGSWESSGPSSSWESDNGPVMSGWGSLGSSNNGWEEQPQQQQQVQQQAAPQQQNFQPSFTDQGLDY